jgi:hypothetical protein
MNLFGAGLGRQADRFSSLCMIQAVHLVSEPELEGLLVV